MGFFLRWTRTPPRTDRGCGPEGASGGESAGAEAASAASAASEGVVVVGLLTAAEEVIEEAAASRVGTGEGRRGASGSGRVGASRAGATGARGGRRDDACVHRGGRDGRATTRLAARASQQRRASRADGPRGGQHPSRREPRALDLT